MWMLIQFRCIVFSVYNCRKAMEIAKREFDIPMVLEPEYLASPYLDELSGMTYLSYFMKDGSPGFRSTLRWVNSQLSHAPVRNFTVSTPLSHRQLCYSALPYPIDFPGWGKKKSDWCPRNEKCFIFYSITHKRLWN